ncbi:MAG: Asp-tRNA(Asn)/Glu-tRNA(Gln) amidotransferase subunit GatB [Bacillota bacterium]|nr:Asp-tRNA(Asn)/Glu-tRNA(Gln) amidotransferase subunit GatB [Bacillota bacterium]
MKYEPVIGLETHIELKTSSKIFCSCPVSFGQKTNTSCCPICTGMPGTLPKLNQAVVDYAIMAGLAVNCKVSKVSRMDRKNYVYPDLCKAYQISQYDMPLLKSGHITLSDGHAIRIKRIHIEEDAGKLIHENNELLIDYNRGGVPLIEVVTEPDFCTSSEVKEYLETLRLIMKTIDVSDCKMQEASLRCDVNLSVKVPGENPGSRVEIKNVNSFAYIVKAIEYEFLRQVNLIEKGQKIKQETRRFNAQTGKTETMRSKEETQDYRYFPEPDLPYIYVSDERIASLAEKLPELPQSRIKRYVEEMKVRQKDAEEIIKYPKLADYFEEIVKISKNPKLSLSLMLNHVYRNLLTEEEKEGAKISVTPFDLAQVVLLQDGSIPASFVKTVVDRMLKEGKSFEELFDISDFQKVSGDDLLEIVKNVIDENPKAASDYKGGKEKSIKALIGLVMRKTSGKADAKLVSELLKERLQK